MRRLPGITVPRSSARPISQARPRRALPWLLPQHLEASSQTNALAERSERGPTPGQRERRF